MKWNFSFIIPVYNRPQEIKELLSSFLALKGNNSFEIVIVEDGSTETSKTLIEEFSNTLNISYYYKKNSGPGASRNYGMKRATGNYFIILDSDCILPQNYLTEVITALNEDYVDYYGGPDAAHESFSNLQKAINFAMTSFLTTGGIRGNKKSTTKFQPRSFNMGISKAAFLQSGGFGNIHPGEDPDLSIRLEQLGFQSKLIPNAFVFHKRRISWKKFQQQVYKFGLARPILIRWYPKTAKITYWFPTFFAIGLLIALVLAANNEYWFLMVYGFYFLLVFGTALAQTKKLIIALQSVLAVVIQFFSYGFGYLKSTILIRIFNKKPEHCFPELFFKNDDEK